eukprot:m.104605 g.104605  ORF g.104605 m.104605 type:complete len:329 (-) comp51603_c0_seq1:125-1111(-)
MASQRARRFAPTEDPSAGYLEYDSDDDRFGLSGGSDDEEGERQSQRSSGALPARAAATATASRSRPIPAAMATDFEAELNADLDDQFEQLRDEVTSASEVASSATRAAPKKAAPTTTTEESEFYHETYFDSDEEKDEGDAGRSAVASQGPAPQKKKNEKRKKQTDDELFYDPNQDDEDDKWVNRQRHAHLRLDMTGQESKAKTAGMQNAALGIKAENNSDAILNCPACMNILCLDCQQHDTYKTQFRAMFVVNCLIVRTEQLSFKPVRQPGRKRRPKDAGEETAQPDFGNSSADELFNPVKCSECGTVVAMYDAEEVYHFFNVIASEP